MTTDNEIARLRAEKDQGASLRDRAGQQSPSPAVSAASAVTITSRGRFIDGIEDLVSEENLREHGKYALPDSIRYDIEREARRCVNVFAPNAPPALLQSIEAALLRAEVRRIRDVRAARALLSDPVAVHHNMLAGTVAMPAIRDMIHLYGPEAVQDALSEMGPPVPDPHPTLAGREGGESHMTRGEER